MAFFYRIFTLMFVLLIFCISSSTAQVDIEPASEITKETFQERVDTGDLLLVNFGKYVTNFVSGNTIMIFCFFTVWIIGCVPPYIVYKALLFPRNKSFLLIHPSRNEARVVFLHIYGNWFLKASENIIFWMGWSSFQNHFVFVVNIQSQMTNIYQSTIK